MALTDLALRTAKPKEKAYKLFDGGGLHLVVNPNGSRLWRLAYRFAGKPKQLAFGPYPTISLAEARQKREDAKKLLLDGRDPSAARKLDKINAAISEGNTFENLAADYMARLAARDLQIDQPVAHPVAPQGFAQHDGQGGAAHRRGNVDLPE